MADLLGSIMKSMEKPPGLNDKQKKILKDQRAKADAIQAREKDRLKKFKRDIQVKIEEFIQNPEKQKQKFEAMNKVHRSLVHEVAEVAGLVSQAFGKEEVDRCVIVWKQEFAPTDDELLVHKRGEEWNEEAAREIAKQRAITQNNYERQEKTQPKISSTSKSRHYDSLASDAVKVTSAKSYGFVSSELKKDKRSIEQTLNEIRAKKKLKAEQGENSERLD